MKMGIYIDCQPSELQCLTIAESSLLASILTWAGSPAGHCSQIRATVPGWDSCPHTSEHISSHYLIKSRVLRGLSLAFLGGQEPGYPEGLEVDVRPLAVPEAAQGSSQHPLLHQLSLAGDCRPDKQTLSRPPLLQLGLGSPGRQRFLRALSADTCTFPESCGGHWKMWVTTQQELHLLWLLYLGEGEEGGHQSSRDKHLTHLICREKELCGNWTKWGFWLTGAGHVCEEEGNVGS